MDKRKQKHIPQALTYEKQGHATIACLVTKFRSCRHVKSCTPTIQVGVWWCAMISPFRTPWFSFFLPQEVQTIIKLKLIHASKEFCKEFDCKKIRARLAKKFFMFVSQFHKVYSDLKHL